MHLNTKKRMIFLKQAEDLRNLKYNLDKILNKRIGKQDERKLPKRRTIK